MYLIRYRYMEYGDKRSKEDVCISYDPIEWLREATTRYKWVKIKQIEEYSCK